MKRVAYKYRKDPSYEYRPTRCSQRSDGVARLIYRVLDPTAAPLLAKKPVDMSLQIARRAYELYEQRGRQVGRAVHRLGEAEREIRKEGPYK